MSDSPDGLPTGPEHTPDDRSPAGATAAAIRYFETALEAPARVREERARVVALLAAEAGPTGLQRRAAASGALAALAHHDPACLGGCLPELAAQLRRELERDPPDTEELAVRSRAVRERLVRSLACVLAHEPERLADLDDPADFVDAIGTDLEVETLRIATKAVFAVAGERPDRLSAAVAPVAEVIECSDPAVRAWAAGALGRLAETDPDAVAERAARLRPLLEHDEGAVRHNALEAVAALVGERPDAVAPAADTLRDLLEHEAVAIQHNAAGVLGTLAETRPDAVVPAADALRGLLGHDEKAVRRVAAGALARLARERPDTVAGP